MKWGWLNREEPHIIADLAGKTSLILSIKKWAQFDLETINSEHCSSDIRESLLFPLKDQFWPEKSDVCYQPLQHLVQEFSRSSTIRALLLKAFRLPWSCVLPLVGFPGQFAVTACWKFSDLCWTIVQTRLPSCFVLAFKALHDWKTRSPTWSLLLSSFSNAQCTSAALSSVVPWDFCSSL